MSNWYPTSFSIRLPSIVEPKRSAPLTVVSKTEKIQHFPIPCPLQRQPTGDYQVFAASSFSASNKYLARSLTLKPAAYDCKNFQPQLVQAAMANIFLWLCNSHYTSAIGHLEHKLKRVPLAIAFAAQKPWIIEPVALRIHCVGTHPTAQNAAIHRLSYQR